VEATALSGKRLRLEFQRQQRPRKLIEVRLLNVSGKLTKLEYEQDKKRQATNIWKTRTTVAQTGFVFTFLASERVHAVNLER